MSKGKQRVMLSAEELLKITKNKVKRRLYFMGDTKNFLSEKMKPFFNNIPTLCDLKIISQFEDFDDSVLKVFGLTDHVKHRASVSEEILIIDDTVYNSGKKDKDAKPKDAVNAFLGIWDNTKD